MSEYTEQAEQFLKEHNISFKAVRKADKCPLWCKGEHDIGFKAVRKADKCPLWCKGEHVHGERYLITFTRKGTKQRYSLSFWNSLNDVQTGKTPVAYDVLAAIQKYDPGDLHEFCQSFGYSEDSIEASRIHKAVVKEWQKVSTFFSVDELKEAQEIN